MVFDCHAHSWRFPEHFRPEITFEGHVPYEQGRELEALKAAWDQPPEKYLEGASGAVDRALLLGVRFGATVGLDVPNDYLAQTARSHPDRLSWGCCVMPTEPGAAAEVERCVRDLGAVAVGELGPSYAHYRADDPRCFPVYEVARDLEVPIFIHAGPTRRRTSRLANADLAAVDDVAIQFPTLKIVICHLGYYRYEETCYLVAKHPNVYADISWMCGIAGLEKPTVGVVTSPQVEYPVFHLLYPLLYHFSQTFGEPDKLLFGSDYPATTSAGSASTVRDLNRLMDQYRLPRIPQAALDRILDENWKKVLPRLAP